MCITASAKFSFALKYKEKISEQFCMWYHVWVPVVILLKEVTTALPIKPYWQNEISSNSNLHSAKHCNHKVQAKY